MGKRRLRRSLRQISTLTAAAADSDGTVSKVEFFHGGTNLIATVTSSPYTYNWSNVAAGSYTLTAVATDNQTAATTSSPVNITVNVAQALYFIQPDQLDTRRVLTNQAQQVVWRWDNDDAFGGNAANNNPGGLGAFEFNLRFPGQYFDKETGNHYNYFRDYSPEIGRYIESDPIGLEGGINTYAYTGSSPLVYSDAQGTYYAAVAAGVVVGSIGGGLGAIATGGKFWTGVAIGAATGGLVASAPTIVPSLAGIGGLVAIRVVAGAAGNAVSQFLNVQTNPCASFNYDSFAASAVGGYASGLRAAGIAQAGLPSTGVAGFAQRAIAGISGAGTATTIGIIGTSLGSQANASGTGISGSFCCAPNTCCSPQ